MPSVAHVVFIPGVLLIGMVIGYIMGSRAARDEIKRRKARQRE
jgi:proteasome assembly chaperone (PAC2) family protein